MNAFKTVALVGAAAAALAIAGGANAAPTFTLDPNTGSASFGDQNLTGHFDDIIQFTLNIPAAETFQFTTSTIKNLKFSSASINGNPISLYTDPVTGASSGFLASFVIQPGVLNTLEIVGDVKKGLGSYGGSITPSAVPEPASWAMMIGGVGFVGGALRRKATRSTNVMVAA